MQIELDRQRIQAKKQALEKQRAADLTKVSLTAADREKRRANKTNSSNSNSQIDNEKDQNVLLVHQHSFKDGNLNQESLAFEIQTFDLQVRGIICCPTSLKGDHYSVFLNSERVNFPLWV